MRRSFNRFLSALICSLGLVACFTLAGCADKEAPPEGDVLTLEEVEAARAMAEYQADAALFGRDEMVSLSPDDTDVMAPFRELAAEEAANGPVESASRTGSAADEITR